MYKIREYILPSIVYPGSWLTNNGAENFKVQGLLRLIEDGLNKSAYSLSKFLIEYDNDIKRYSNTKANDDEQWDKKINLQQEIRGKYCLEHNVMSDSFLPADVKKRMIIEMGAVDIMLGEEPEFWTRLTSYYANNFALAINEIVVGVRSLKEYKEIFINLNLYYEQVNQLLQIVPDSKDIRDSISHAEDRSRGKARKADIQVKSKVYDNKFLKSSGSASVFFNNTLLNNLLTYTNASGESSQIEISIATFGSVEKKVQEVIDNINYKDSNHPRLMKI